VPVRSSAPKINGNRAGWGFIEEVVTFFRAGGFTRLPGWRSSKEKPETLPIPKPDCQLF
jgi:hypothetical protein